MLNAGKTPAKIANLTNNESAGVHSTWNDVILILSFYG